VKGRFWREAAVPMRRTLGYCFASLVGQRSRRQLRTCVSSDHLWRLSKGAQEGAAHAVAIGETRLPGDGLLCFTPAFLTALIARVRSTNLNVHRPP
jgi:hypothetical protein